MQAEQSLPGGLVGKNPLAMQETQEKQVWSLCQADPLEEKMATHSSILAWRIPWTEETGWLQSTVLQSGTQLNWLSMNTGGQNKFGANDFHLSELLGNLSSIWKLPRENT